LTADIQLVKTAKFGGNVNSSVDDILLVICTDASVWRSVEDLRAALSCLKDLELVIRFLKELPLLLGEEDTTVWAE